MLTSPEAFQRRHINLVEADLHQIKYAFKPFTLEQPFSRREFVSQNWTSP